MREFAAERVCLGRFGSLHVVTRVDSLPGALRPTAYEEVLMWI